MNQSYIHILPEDLQNQIAAGEVVERPASVIKELLENSLDAGADRIYAEIEGGGQNRILVQDNGHGLSPQDLSMALNRHATSKILDISDLSRVGSFGFRGEALPSIASVSRLEISSVTSESTEGTQIKVEFGEIWDQHPASLREGTKIQVQDLFINTPARLKFLKTTSTEAKRCQEVIKRFALANLHTQFQFLSNNKNIFYFLKNQGLVERLSHMWPPAVTDNLYPFSYSEQDFAITGAVSDPASTQPKTDRIYFFVNNRPVQNKILLGALREAYKGRLLSKEYPQAVLFLNIPCEEVDINVHPAKSEVRFRSEQTVFSLVKKGVQKALDGDPYKGAPTSRSQEQAFKPNFLEKTKKNLSEQNYTTRSLENYTPTAFNEETKEFFEADNTAQIPSNEKENFSFSHLEKQKGYFYLGQIQATYLLLSEKGNNLLILDQHAAHERILFHKFRSSSEKSGSQLLALPREHNLHPEEKKELQKKANYLRQLGFSFQLHGEELLSINSIPEFFTFHEAKDFLESVLSAKVEGMDDIWTLMACKRAIKAGEEISREEALTLLESWLETPNRFYCPHGRPAVVRLDPKKLQDLFKRR